MRGGREEGRGGKGRGGEREGKGRGGGGRGDGVCPYRSRTATGDGAASTRE